MKREIFGFLTIIFVFITTLVLLHSTSSGTSSDEVNWHTDDFVDMRIENEDKLDVPVALVDEVWDYMLNRLVKDKEFLKSLDPNLTSYWQDELFIDVYFDTPDLIMLNRQSGIRHRARYNLTDTTARKHGRELMQVKLNNIDDNAMNRGELKFQIDHSVKRNTADDLHPVLSLVDGADRGDFMKLMTDIGIDPFSLKEILINKQRRRSLYIPRNGQQFISIRLDECTFQMLFFEQKHVELEPELNEVPYTAADSTERAFMESINRRIVDDILQEFPEIKRDLTPKYNKAFNYFEKRIPFLRSLFKYGLL